MRVTQMMVGDTVRYNLQRSLNRLEKLSNQLSTGKVFHRPSDNPVGVNKSMRYTASIDRNEQYRLNMTECQGWMDATEYALLDGISVLQKIRVICLDAAHDVHTDEDREIMAKEVEELYNHLVGVGNTEFNSLYIFAGHQTLEAPYREVAGTLTYLGDDGVRNLEISPFQEVTLNLTGNEAFRGTGIFDDVRKILDALHADDSAYLGNEGLMSVDSAINDFLDGISTMGARLKRVEIMQKALMSENIHLREMRSGVEDIDLALTITEYMMQENVHHAALSTGARTMMPTLIDYLR
ncbi:MAG: flagellar hook-associated protein FlgL [Firmicutes bacterium]|jgi:flagellar hook-associated protein 3 FlgL|nr:flagellar hook-associated protein FlgL [Bacillota bacterium]